MNASEHAVGFACRGQWLVGVLHAPDHPLPRGVLVITGGPQYRAGSHRQFVLLARHLAARGIAVMRFDYRGMGDSDGAIRTFEQVADDVRAAVNHFLGALPVLRELVLWGLCDGATAAAFHAAGDRRIAGLVLLNPWVRTEAGAARATLRHYYWRRLRSGAFWRKLASGAVHGAGAIAGMRRLLASARSNAGEGDLPQRLLSSLSTFDGRVLIILSGADLVAREFDALAARDPRWRALLAHARVTRAAIADANHTFARQAWRDRAAWLTANWLASW
ncbi:MAG: hydrolase 1, exosortase A system-associated [Duganella sp.]